MKIVFSSFFILLLFCSCSTNPSSGQKNVDTKLFENRQFVDLSHTYSEETVYWVTSKEFKLDTVFNGQTEDGYFYAANNFSTAEHGGTHIDAPIHFAKKGLTVDQIPLETLIGSAIKIDVTSKTSNNPDYLITKQDFMDWEANMGINIPTGSIVLLETGFSKYYPNKVKYLGTDERGEKAVEKLHFPGLSPEAATWLIENRNIHSIGIDTPSIDFGQSKYFKAHVILLGENISVFENLTNLDELPKIGFEIIALPMKIKGGSGSPLRVVAIIKE